MSVNLDLFTIPAASKHDKPAEPAYSAANHPVWVALSNALLAALEHASASAAATRKAQRIAARLDDPSIQGTPEMRSSAEAAHWSCVQTAKRERDELHRVARRISSKLWTDAWAEHRDWVLTDFPRGWHGEPLWELIRMDRTVAPLEPWRSLVQAHDALGDVGEEVPF